MTASCTYSNDGLIAAHAYTVLDSLELKDTSGNSVVKLLKIRNPWGREEYNGPWNDNDSRWTDHYRR